MDSACPRLRRFECVSACFFVCLKIRAVEAALKAEGGLRSGALTFYRQRRDPQNIAAAVRDERAQLDHRTRQTFVIVRYRSARPIGAQSQPRTIAPRCGAAGGVDIACEPISQDSSRLFSPSEPFRCLKTIRARRHVRQTRTMIRRALRAGLPSSMLRRAHAARAERGRPAPSYAGDRAPSLHTLLTLATSTGRQPFPADRPRSRTRRLPALRSCRRRLIPSCPDRRAVGTPRVRRAAVRRALHRARVDSAASAGRHIASLPPCASLGRVSSPSCGRRADRTLATAKIEAHRATCTVARAAQADRRGAQGRYATRRPLAY